MSTQEPELQDLIAAALDAALLDVHVSLIGHVVRRNGRLVDVRPVLRAKVKLEDGGADVEELPILPNIPIGYKAGGGWQETFPLAVGDPVRLVFSEQYTGGYRASGQVGSDPGLLSRFDLSSAVAIPCDERNSNAAEVSDTDWIVNGPGVFRVGGAGAGFVALASLVSSLVDAAVVGHIHLVTTPTGPSGPGSYIVGNPPMPGVAATKLKSE